MGQKGKWRLVAAGCFWNFLGDEHCLTLSEPGEGRAGEVHSAIWPASRAVVREPQGKALGPRGCSGFEQGPP